MASSDRIYAKKKTYGYKERDEEKRRLYLEALKDIPLKELVYLDESGIDDNQTYDYAWGMKGLRIYAMKQAERKERVSIIGALNEGKIKAPFMFEGGCDRQVFEAYVKHVLIPELRPGQTVVMDNASFHKGGQIRTLIENAGCNILYLPAYSPDLNPIEHYWAPLKYHIKMTLTFIPQLQKAIQYVFQYVLT